MPGARGRPCGESRGAPSRCSCCGGSMRKGVRLALALAGTLSVTSVAADVQAVSPKARRAADEGTPGRADVAFMHRAAAVHARAITLGKHAQEHAQSPGLRRYGQ